MWITDILSALTRRRLAEIARSLDIVPRDLTKARLAWVIRGELRSRTAEAGGEPSLTAMLDILLRKLNTSDLRTAYAAGLEGDRFAHTPGERFGELRRAELKALTTALCVAAQESGGRGVDEVLGKRAWKRYFDSEPFAPIEEWKGELPAALDVDPAAWDEEPWEEQLSFRGGPGAHLPGDLEPRAQPLLEHQERSLAHLRRWWHAESERGILCMPTGSGKTRTAVALVLRDIIPSGRRVLWLAHRRELVNQAIAALLEHGSEAAKPFTVGRFEAGDRKYFGVADCLVASIPTLTWRPGKHDRRLPNLTRLLSAFGRFDVAIVDECHHSPSPSWHRLLRTILHYEIAPRLLGLSATPTRTAESEVPALWRLFGGIIHEETAVELIHERILARPRLFLESTGERFEATAEQRRDFEQFDDLPVSLVRSIAASESRNEYIVDAIVSRRREGQSLVFASDIEQSEELATRLRRSGLAAECLHNRKSVAERRRVLDAFRAGVIEVLVNVILFTEGTDLPRVRSIYIARPTRSRILFEQMVGRGLRGPRVGGTDTCDIIGFSDEVTGLVHQQLTSTFLDQAEAGAMFGGWDEVEDAATLSLDPDEAERDERTVRADRLAALLDGGDLDAARRELGFLGWWELDGVAALPVFASDRARVAAVLAGALDAAMGGRRTDGDAPALDWVGPAQVESFATHVAAGRAPVFRAAAGQPPDRVRGVLRGIGPRPAR